jgi:subtilisin family serine protease
MPARRVIVEYRSDPELARPASSSVKALEAEPLEHLLPAEDVVFDPAFAPVRLPAIVTRGGRREEDGAPLPTEADPSAEGATYLLRAELGDAQIEALRAHDAVAGVFSDPVVEPCLTCIDSPALGDDADVEELLRVADLRGCEMTGEGVMVAIVDGGVNVAYLAEHGKHPSFSAAASWGFAIGVKPGSVAVGHGTMCAFDACIAAPACTLLDIAVLRPFSPIGTGLGALLSDAVRAFSHLQGLLAGPDRPRALVVSNSWGMFHPSWDLPPGDAGNFSDNPNHPFNRSVGALAALGADILFAAGNCGPQCPDSRCQGVSSNAIYGANGHPQVLTVAGVDIANERVGYSSIGPGRLTDRKPDVSGYTHFKGSGVFPSDSGTSAATPVVAGVIAAVRSKRAFDSADPATSPAAIRALITSTAHDLGTAGYDYEHGYGVVDGARLRDEVCEEARPQPAGG